MSPQDVDIVLIAWCLFPRSGDCRNHLVWFWISMVLDMIADISLSASYVRRCELNGKAAEVSVVFYVCAFQGHLKPFCFLIARKLAQTSFASCNM